MRITLSKLASYSMMLLLSVGLFQSVSAEDKPFAEKKIILQISDGNPFKQTLVLNVAGNLLKEYGQDKVEIEIVAFGPGVRLFFDGNANTGRLKSLNSSGVKYTACSNTIKNMSKKLGHKVGITSMASTTSPGVVRITKLITEDGYALIKP